MGLREQSAEIIFNIWKKKRKPQWDDVDWSALTDQHKEAFYEVADQILKLEPENGTGDKVSDICPDCKGTGKVINQTKVEMYSYWYKPDFFKEDCPTCHGTGNKQPVAGLQAEIEELSALLEENKAHYEGRIKELKAEIREYDQIFNLTHKANMRAVKLWREGHPERELRMPDQTDMVVWLLEKLDKLETEKKAIYKWGNETCTNQQHRAYYITMAEDAYYTKRHECDYCWQELEKEIE